MLRGIITRKFIYIIRFKLSSMQIDALLLLSVLIRIFFSSAGFGEYPRKKAWKKLNFNSFNLSNASDLCVCVPDLGSYFNTLYELSI